MFMLQQGVGCGPFSLFTTLLLEDQFFYFTVKHTCVDFSSLLTFLFLLNRVTSLVHTYLPICLSVMLLPSTLQKNVKE